MGTAYINIYDDAQSNIILDEGSSSPNITKFFTNLGEPLPGEITPNYLTFKNSYFLELNLFDDKDNFLFTLNSGRPLLMKNDGSYHLGDYHIHGTTYMVGDKHMVTPHESLSVFRNQQINVYPVRNSNTIQAQRQYMIKVSEIFEVGKNVQNIDLKKDTNYKITYAVFRDVMLALGAEIESGGGV